ncbi:MAG: hypothetical protein P8N15_06120 [Flavobacteriaceae bacterium]|jgi:hypothetical protein|nr:hypothetical protein [Flavobacteriaceae bacterium]
MNRIGYSFLLSLFALGILTAQENEQEPIGTQEVLVVKSYTPSLSDAFKIKSVPKLSDSLTSLEKKLVYELKKVPVISTFEPNKASPLRLQQRKSSTPYNTFFSGGFGNMSQLYFNVSSVVEMDRTQRFGINFYRDGFGTDLANSLLKSSQNYSRFGLHHNLRNSYYNANSLLQFETSNTNYFGLYDRDWDPLILNSTNPESRRNYFKIRTHWNWYDDVLRGITFQADLTSDNFNSTEQQLGLQTDFEVDLGGGKLKSELHLQGFHTAFETSYFERTLEEYTQGKGTLNLFWKHSRNDVKLKIGAGAAYLLGVENSSSSLLYYPQLEVVYRKTGNVLSPYLRAEGGVQFNTYKSLTLTNPYLAPTTLLTPTFNRYNASLGIRSQLASVLNFDLGFIYDQVENFNIFERLPFDKDHENQAYRLSNAYAARYVDTDLYGFKASLRIDLAKDNFVLFETRYRVFETNGNQELWNVPALEMNWESQFQWKDRLAFSLSGNLWGDRKAAFRPIFIDQDLNSAQTPLPENIPLFISTTAHLTYRLTDQFDAFAKVKVNSQETHGRWAYYQEPQLLLLGGIVYKFDFQY